MDRLEELWDIQKRFSDKIIFDSEEQGTKELSLHIMSELDELLREISWKIHRKDKKVIIRNNLLEEIIDLQKYVWSIALLWNFDLEEFCEEFKRKSKVVEQRWEQELSLSNMYNSENKIIGVDIDGVIADYPTSFLQFVGTFGIKVPPDISHSRELLLSSQEHEHYKHLYREMGCKRDIPVIKGSKEFLIELSKNAYFIVLLTSRPYKRYKRIFADTMEWLAKNGLLYHAIIFDEEKNLRLYREFGDRVAFFIEDELEKANDIARIGIKVYLINKKYNVGDVIDGVIRVKNLQEILENEI